MTTTTATTTTVDSDTSALPAITHVAADGSTLPPADRATADTGQGTPGATAGPTGSRTYPTGRPLNPKVRRTRRGWQVTLPVARGAKKTRQATFATKAQATAWKNAGVAALDAGQPLPDPADVDAPGGDQQAARAQQGAGDRDTVRDPDDVRDRQAALESTSQVAAPPTGDDGPPVASAAPASANKADVDETSFAAVAHAWCDERFVKLRRGQPGREAHVRAIIANHLAPLMDRHGCRTGADLQRVHHVNFLSALGQGQTTDIEASTPTGASALTVAQAAQRAAVSPSTIKRRLADGAFPHSYLQLGIRMIPEADLHAAGLMTGSALRRGPRTAAEGYSSDVLADIDGILKAILAYGVATAGWTLRYDTATVERPTTVQQSAKRGHVCVSDCVRMAESMHVVHQITMWITRLQCLRVSEAYGIYVGDVDDLGDRGLLRVRRQGGRHFLVRQPDGTVTSEPEKDGGKTAESWRLQIISKPLMDLIRRTIAIFHTDADGNVDRNARLIPGLNLGGVSGQGAFRAALAAAAREAGVTVTVRTGTVETQETPTPKDLRAGTVTDLAWGNVPELLRKRFAGHAAGSDVHAAHYVLDHHDIARQLFPVAVKLEELVDQAAPTTGLVIPTTRSCTTANQPALHVDADRIDAALLACGWLVAPTATVDDQIVGATVSTEQAGDVLGLAPSTVRRWVREGRFPGSARYPDGSHAIPLAQILAERKHIQSLRRLTDVCADLDYDYHEAYNRSKTNGWPLTDDADYGLLVPADTEAQLRAYLDGVAALHARALPMITAAELLGLRPSIVEALVRDGDLRVDEQRGPRNARFITRASIAVMADRLGRDPVAREETLVADIAS
ncbi:MAG: hypothetical protein QG597_4286 [Actinomycetota bacterium]|nr:hypothetical protein [Actinomycetota bacterium]